MSLVSIKNAKKTYNPGKSNAQTVIKNTSLELPKTGMIAIFGPSGCGKTSLLNAIGGLDDLDSGKIEINNIKISSKEDELRNKYIGYIFQNYNLNIEKTVFENVSDALYLCGMTNDEEIKKRTLASLANVEMENYVRRTPDTLSGGQCQRVAIARAIVKNPAIILADEPTGNLDENSTIMIMDLLKEIAKDRLVILVTHEQDLVEHYCDKSIEIKDGQVLRFKEINKKDKENTFLSKNKNHIYLKDLKKETKTLENIKLNLYGDFDEKKLEIDIVSLDGKLYLQTSLESLKYIEETSEIKLIDDSFVNLKNEKENSPKKIAKLKMEELTPFEGKNYGKLFTFKNSIKDAFKRNFQKKKSEKLLFTTLIILGFVLVFTIASSGVGIRNLQDVKKTIPKDALYIALSEDTDTSFIYDNTSDNAISSTQLITHQSLLNSEYLVLQVGNFLSAPIININFNSRIYDDARLKNMKVLSGEKTISDDELVITSNLAKKLLDASTVSFIKDIDDLLGTIYLASDSFKTIVGIVESDELALYQTRRSLLMQTINYSPYSFSKNALTIDLQDDEIILFNTPHITKNQEIYIHGLKFKVKESYSSESFTLEKLTSENATLKKYQEYASSLEKDDFKTKVQYYCEKVYSDELVQKYLLGMGTTLGLNEYLTLAKKLSSSNDDLLKLYALLRYTNFHVELGLDKEKIVLALMYKTTFGTYPSEEELDQYLKNTFKINDIDEILEATKIKYDELTKVLDDNSMFILKEFFLTENSALKLLQTYGKTSDEIFNLFYIDENDVEDHNSSSLYLMVTSSNIDKTYDFLKTKIDESKIITPKEEVETITAECILDFISSLFSIFVISVLMAFSVYAIMRSRFMTKVKEVGIYRAIGVSRKNLIFKYWVEAIVVASLSTMISFFASTIIIWCLSKEALFNSLFYFPLWRVCGCLVFILGIFSVFGTLPAILLLRKTPSEILAKYDI